MNAMIQLYYQHLPHTRTPVQDLSFISFPGGERHVRLPVAIEGIPSGHNWVIEARMESPADIMDLLLLTDALRRARPGERIELAMPYVPYARQDRVAVSGEAFSLAVFCSLINSLKFDSVTVMDPHSQVAVDLLDRVVVMSVADILPSTLKAQGADELLATAALVAPDKGAMARVQKAADALSVYRGSPVTVVQALKQRDPVTGALSSPVLQGHVPQGVPLLVVDDICDGGGTFIQLAELLRQHTDAPLYLYVTHGIFSKGLGPLLPHFDRIFCAYPFARASQHFVVHAAGDQQTSN
jgi:ribose-phosphate pyrophosphokinase